MAKTDSVIEGLTQRQAEFVSYYLQTGNATESYIKAGYKAKNENVASTSAARLLRNARIARAIQKRQQQRNERLQLDEDFELKQALKILKMCSEPKQVYVFDQPMKDTDGNYVFQFDSRGANSALTTICKLRGKFVEKKQIDVTLSDRSDWLATILKDVNDDK